ncbi:MAG: HAD family phosphatase [Terracidiphilus sp.]
MRAVIFDYGMVLSGPQEPEAHAALLRITGLGRERFERLYWADRPAYDEGKLTGIAFWRKLLSKAGLAENEQAAEELNRWDARMWTTENAAMLHWQLALRKHGLKTAILSNMGDEVLASVEREFDWIHRFDVLVWSYQLGIAKPDSAIYRHTIVALGTEPEDTLFIDDKRENIDAARALGMQTIQFSTVDRLREDLIAAGLESELPLPS